MAGYKIQLKDKNGNRQYPVSTTDVVVDADGVSVADLLDRKQPTLVSGVNIKTINGKTLLGEGDLVIEGGTADLSGYATEDYVDAKVGNSYPVHVPMLIGVEVLTDEQKEENKATYEAIRDAGDDFFPHIYLAPNKGLSFIPTNNHYDDPVGNIDLLLSVDSLIASVRELESGDVLKDWEDEKFLGGAAISVRLYADGNVEVTQQEVFATPSVNVFRAILTYIALGMGGGGASLIPDSEMSDTSTNAVQNKVIKAYVDSKVGGGSGETAESDVICVVWDDDTSDIPSNKEAYQKLAECCETVGKPAAVMVCVETGYRWGIEHFYWKTRFEDIELVTPVRNDGMYAIFTLTSEGVCTADFKQVSLGGGGESVLGNNVITLYEPTIDGDTDEIVSSDECLAEIENNFGYDIELPQEIKDAVSAFIISMKEHNASEYARARELTENGEKVIVMLRGYGYPMIFLGIYLIALVEAGEPSMTPEEFVSGFNALMQLEEMIFPKRYIAADSIEGEFGIEVAHDKYTLQPDENGEWTITSRESVRKYATLYYEGTARLTAKQCETNLKSKGHWLNNCDFQVNRYRGNGWSDNEDVLIIGKSTKTVTDFVDLDGTVSTRDVVAFRYLDGLRMVELQVSTHDGYCRKVVLGQLQLA